MATGNVTYEVRADNKKLKTDLNKTKGLVTSAVKGIASATTDAFIGIGKGLLDVVGSSTKLGISFEQTFAKASTLFGDVAVDTDNLKRSILELSKSTGVAADELNEGLYTALSAGIPITEDATEAMEFLESSSMLAKAGFTDVDTAISATAKTLNAYNLPVSEAGRIQELLIQTQNKGITTVNELGQVLAGVTPTAAALNVSFEEVSASLAIMTKQGTPTAVAVTQLNGLLAELGKQGTKASKNLALATKGTEFAGKSFIELRKEGVGLNEILDIMSKFAEKSGLQMLDLFGNIRAGKGALALSGKNFEEFTGLIEEMTTATGGLDEAYEKMANTTSARLDRLKRSFEALGIEIFNSLAPAFEKVIPLAQKLADGVAPILVKNFEELTPIIEEMIPEIEELMVDFLAELPGILEEMRESILPLIRDSFPKWIELITKLLPILPKLLDALITLADDVLPQLLDALIEIIPYITDMVDGLKELEDEADGPIGQLLGKVFDLFILGAKTANEELDKLLGKYKEIKEELKKITEGGFFEKIEGVKGILDNTGDITEALSNPGKTLIEQTTRVVGDKVGEELDKRALEREIERIKAERTSTDFTESFGGVPTIPSQPTFFNRGSGSSVNVTVTGNTISDQMDVNRIGEDMVKVLNREGVFK